jgi:predicted methyltransferase
MRRATAVSVLSAVVLAAGSGWAAEAPPAHIKAALADKGRPAADVSRDAARKPAELLAFAGVKPGDHVVDLIMGGGYFTHILSAAVGPSGKVYAYQPAEFIKFQASYGKSLKDVAAAHGNITPLDGGLVGLDLPDGLDLVLTVQNYHDLHLGLFPADTAAKANAEIFRSLKPGGAYVIVDHVGPTGYGPKQPMDGTHRIDPAILRKEVEAAGFRFAGESNLYRNPADPKTANVFDASIRGKTDQVAYRFVKPR